jgi:hypothetical protein
MNFANFVIPLLFLADKFASATDDDTTGNCKLCHQKLKGIGSDTFVSNEKEYQIFPSLIHQGINGVVSTLLSFSEAFARKILAKNFFLQVITIGLFTQVYHVPTTGLVDFDEKSIEHCIALKRVNKASNKAMQLFHNEVGILKEFATLDKDHRRHLLTIYQV